MPLLQGLFVRPITFTEIPKHRTQIKCPFIFIHEIKDFFFSRRGYNLLPLWQITAAPEASVSDLMIAVHVWAANLKNDIMAARMQAEL
jgi:hypothetical protein